ncbi:MAG: 3-deoxy-D-manno-octulosonic acid transferase [Phycisphaerales bacterium]|nr:MAG: 3-deoxy-D-manno-octulosonic acid transferase [Phycisphaerales bacterium]
MTILLDVFYLLAALVISPVIVYRVFRHKRYRTGWAERFGRVAHKDPAAKCIWLHAVSVGEVNASRTIVQELQKKLSDFEIVISATTDTGMARARALFGDRLQVFYFPFDLSWVMRRAFDRIRPTICLLMELEVWPNFVETARRRNIPVVVVNGRLSDKSFSGYKRIRPFVKGTFRKISLFLAQTDEYARRFRRIGAAADKVIVTGSLKYDTAQTDGGVEGADALVKQLGLDSKRLWVAGGTGNDEEQILLGVYRDLRQDSLFSDLRLAIVPRKPERFDEVAALIEQTGLAFVRYSQIKANPTALPSGEPEVILGDTMGDLRKFYSLATIIFVGRSLVPMGGSDMMEAAALGKCTTFGPHAFNFRQTVDALLAAEGAILVRDAGHLLATMKKCLSEPDFTAKIAENGREVIKNNQGATARTIEQIARLLGRV